MGFPDKKNVQKNRDWDGGMASKSQINNNCKKNQKSETTLDKKINS